ncbi:hypothetical protein LQ327_09090 [Actinomycetospora endophytica]|uniref:Uncharacterized protein n=1 Tax=Actinomycetospora endophytica TaxID=2291215 RepID=A0ABS8P6H4_9PSEU|nr:hypothetical protein [Actinomycetospora endophytica]MCD2193537.1 hypothetical protein [Actinomycetospora endophytica]
MERNCIGCGQVDDHPRHHISIGEDDVFWHMDCHARSGQGCELCKAVVDSAGELKGDELRAHIQQNDPAKQVLVARGLVAQEG